MNLEPINQINLMGHNEIFNEIINLYKGNKLPNKILLSGEKGIGKCTMAYHLVNYVLSYDEDFPYDLEKFKINTENKFFRLTLNKSNPNFNFIDIPNDKKNINIDQVRSLILNLNKSSFNSKPRFVLIDNIEFLNINSSNALLKILEEPNYNINFILINNNKRVMPTLKSRCLDFKASLTLDKSIEIFNEISKENIFDLLNRDLINNYSTPGQLFKILNFSKEFSINLKDISLRDFLSLIINDKSFKKDIVIRDLIYSLIELYFRNNTSTKDIKLIKMFNYFLKKINNTKKFNLDEESLFIEFEDRVLNG